MKSRPRHRIQAVQAMTGVPAATLRTWERRYQVVEPARNQDNKYRLYSDEDVERIRHMAALCARGIPPREAALQVQEGGELLRLGPLSAALLSAARARDFRAFDGTLQAVLGWGRAIEVYDQIIVPVLRQIESDPEDLRQAVDGRVARWLRDMSTMCQPDEPGPWVLVASQDDEELLALESCLRLAFGGWRSRFVGRRTPPPAIRSALSLSPAAVVVVCVSPTSATEFGEYASDTPTSLLLPESIDETRDGLPVLTATHQLAPWLDNLRTKKSLH